MFQVTILLQEVFFLGSFNDLWVTIILSCMAGCGTFFFFSGILQARLWPGNKKHVWIYLPIANLIMGAAIGFIYCSVCAAAIAALYVSAFYEIGIDTAAGIGIAMAIMIVYFHMGKADFIQL